MIGARAGFRILLALAYAVAGVAHLRTPAGFLAITPDWVPAPALVIAVTGWCEIAGAIGLLIPRLRWWAGVALAAYAVCVFPANIKHAVEAVPISGVVLGPVYHVPRLLLQPVLVWWALWAGGVTDWPWRRRPRPAR